MNEKNSVQSGTLYLVSTPIGNLSDITLRALDVLKQVDLIAAEDTRLSKILLQHYDIRVPLVSYHEHNEKRMTLEIIKKLQQGQTIALITDAGTPGISDPGFYLVRASLQAKINIIPIPGATAFLPALIVSGLPCDRFVFEGFLPHKKGRQKRMQQLCEEQRTIIFYESPMRIKKTLNELLQIMGDRPAVIARELTKKFEQVVRGQISEIIHQFDQMPCKGEFVLIVAGVEKKKRDSEYKIK